MGDTQWKANLDGENPETVAVGIIQQINEAFIAADVKFVIQVGDPNSRDYTKKHLWGTGGSGKPVGLAELSRKRRHLRGAVAMAHSGNPAQADAQFYVTLNAVPRLDGKYVVFGRVINGMDAGSKIAVGDVIRKASVKP